MNLIDKSGYIINLSGSICAITKELNESEIVIGEYHTTNNRTLKNI